MMTEQETKMKRVFFEITDKIFELKNQISFLEHEYEMIEKYSRSFARGIYGNDILVEYANKYPDFSQKEHLLMIVKDNIAKQKEELAEFETTVINAQL